MNSSSQSSKPRFWVSTFPYLWFDEIDKTGKPMERKLGMRIVGGAFNQELASEIGGRHFFHIPQEVLVYDQMRTLEKVLPELNIYSRFARPAGQIFQIIKESEETFLPRVVVAYIPPAPYRPVVVLDQRSKLSSGEWERINFGEHRKTFQELGLV